MKQKWIIYAVIGAIVLATGWEINHVLVKNAAQVAAAQQHDKQVSADNKNLQDLVKTEQAKRVAAENSIRVVTKRIVVREQNTQKQEAELTVPKSVQDVQNDSAKILGVKPDITPDGKLAYAPKDVQQILVTKVEHDQLASDKLDLKKAFDQAQLEASSLNTQLVATQKQLADETSSADKWKNAAVSSKPKKVLDGIKHVGELAAVAAVSYELGKHLK